MLVLFVLWPEGPASFRQMDHFNENPVVHTWSYKLKKAA